MSGLPKQRSATKNGNKAASSVGHLFGQSTRKTGLDAGWNAVNPDVLHQIVWAISELGGSVTIGTTKNGSAYYFKVYMGAPYDPLYFDGDEEGRAEMGAWAETLVNAVAEIA